MHVYICYWTVEFHQKWPGASVYGRASNRVPSRVYNIEGIDASYILSFTHIKPAKLNCIFRMNVGYPINLIELISLYLFLTRSSGFYY